MSNSNKLYSSVNPSGWAPSIHYKQSLDDIRNQSTPAQIYKTKARALNRIQKNIQRLDLVIQLNHQKCTRAALKIQNCFRNTKKRQRLKALQGSSELMRNHSITNAICTQKISENDIAGAIAALDEMAMPPDHVLLKKSKMLYSLGDFIRSEGIAKRLIEASNTNEDAHFVYVSSLVSQQKYRDAYEAVRTAMIYVETPRDDIMRLYGLICMKVSPPMITEAIETFDNLVKQHGEDMNALLQRATCYLCIHDWERAIEDLSIILHYQPKLLNVICLRARAYMCQRDWAKAKTDYKRALRIDPEYQEAIDGLGDISQPHVELPMVDSKFISESSSS